MTDNEPLVVMHNLLCIGGCANGERADIPSNQTIVCCALRTPLKVRMRNRDREHMDQDIWFRHDEYRRTWFRFGRGEREFEVLLCNGTSDQEADYLIRELFQKGIRP